MKKRNIIALVLCIALCVCMLAGCGAKKADKTLIVATNVSFPPYEYYEGEKAIGIDIDIMQAICDKLGYQMEVQDMEFGSIITSVAAGKADVGVGAITVTEDRAKSVHFTTSYATGKPSIVWNVAPQSGVFVAGNFIFNTTKAVIDGNATVIAQDDVAVNSFSDVRANTVSLAIPYNNQSASEQLTPLNGIEFVANLFGVKIRFILFQFNYLL